MHASLESRRAGRLYGRVYAVRTRVCAARRTPERGASSSDRFLARARAGLFKRICGRKSPARDPQVTPRGAPARGLGIFFFVGRDARARMMRAIDMAALMFFVFIV